MSKQTLPEWQAQQLENCTEKIAKSLTDLAERIKQQGSEFSWLAVGKAHQTRTATKIAADIVNSFTQDTGQIGARLWTLITDAGELDAEMQRNGTQSPDAATRP
jgi:hypothetical protein